MPTTIHEIPHEDPSFQAFLDERERQRGLAIEQYRRLAEDLQTRLAALSEQEQSLYDEMIKHESGLGDRFRARAAAKRQRRDSARDLRRTLGGEMDVIAQTWNLNQPARALRENYDDYAYTVTASADSDRLDPVLVAIPSSRVRDDRGWKIYSKRNALFGSRELARVLGNTIAVPRSDEDCVRAAILIAKDRCLPPLKFNGTDRFVALARRIAAEHGLSEGGVQNTVSGVGPVTPGASSTAGAQADRTSPGPNAQKSAALLEQQFATLNDLGVTAASEISYLDAQARIAQNPLREFILLARNDETVILLDAATRDTVRASIRRFADADRIVPGTPFHLHVDANGLLAYGAGAGVAQQVTSPEPASDVADTRSAEESHECDAGDVDFDTLKDAFEGVAADRSMCDARDLPAGAEIEGAALSETTIDEQRFGLVNTGPMLVAVRLSPGDAFTGEVMVTIREGGEVSVQQRGGASASAIQPPEQTQSTQGHTPGKRHGGRSR